MKQKQILSLVVTSAVLFSSMGMAAEAEPVGRDAQLTVTADAGSQTVSTVAEKETREESEKETVSDIGNETESQTGSGTESETEPETGEETKEAAGEETEEESGEETEEESGKEAGEEAVEETEKGTEGDNQEKTEEGTEEETEEGTEGEIKEDDLPENSESMVSSEQEKLEVKLPSVLLPSVHEHSWSVDWNYDGTCHWHECDAEDCPVADDSQKDGYGEHTFDDYGVCIDCGYDAMDGIAAAAVGDVPTYQEAYEAMIALKETYPEGMTWTNYEPYGSKGQLGSSYTWKGGAVYGAKSGVGCMAFAFILSDEAFGSLPARVIERGGFTFEDVKPGDILRINGNSHSVIVLQKSTGGVTVAEGNYNKSVHWGRAMSAAQVKDADFMITRYPKDYIPSDDSDDEVAFQGTAGSLSWSLTNGGVLTISGDGAIPNFSQNNSPWSGHDFYTVVIEDGVTGIGDYAFYQSEALSVYIPDSVTDIGRNAFGESALVAVTIPGTVKTIGDSAFYMCKNLTSATVCEGVETIEDNAFRGCTALAYIDFPASITSVGAGAFMSCQEMVSVRFMPGSNAVTLGDNLFSQCWNLTSVTLPQTADSISAGMFQSCTLLPELYIPASVQTIGENPFTSCRNLRVINFGGSEAEWNSMATAYLKASLQSNGTTVRFDAVFDDPFASDPDDPGDFVPGESDSCTSHIDADNDGKCDNCGKSMSADNPAPGGDDPKPGEDDPKPGEDNPPPDEDKKDPSGSGSNNNSAANGSSGGSSDSSGGSSDSDESGRFDGSGNPTVSSTSSRESDGTYVVKKTQQDGTVITTATDAAGRVEVKAQLSALGIQTAEQKGQAVALPISALQVFRDISMAPSVTVHTQRERPVKVAIPVVSPTPGTVAVTVNEDGSTNVIPACVPTADNVVVFLSNGATVKIVDNSRSFSDVPAGAWYEDAVSFVSARGLFYGTTETMFAPGAPMTYAALATALARFDGVRTEGGTVWYEKSMEWAAARGIRDGAGPDSNITCGQLVTMLWKYQGSPAGDANQVSDQQKAMDWAVKNDIVSVFGSEILDPQMQVNRSQAAQVIMEFARKIDFKPAQQPLPDSEEKQPQ